MWSGLGFVVNHAGLSFIMIIFRVSTSLLKICDIATMNFNNFIQFSIIIKQILSIQALIIPKSPHFPPIFSCSNPSQKLSPNIFQSKSSFNPPQSS